MFWLALQRLEARAAAPALHKARLTMQHRQLKLRWQCRWRNEVNMPRTCLSIPGSPPSRHSFLEGDAARPATGGGT